MSVLSLDTKRELVSVRYPPCFCRRGLGAANAIGSCETLLQEVRLGRFDSYLDRVAYSGAEWPVRCLRHLSRMALLIHRMLYLHDRFRSEREGRHARTG